MPNGVSCFAAQYTQAAPLALSRPGRCLTPPVTASLPPSRDRSAPRYRHRLPRTAGRQSPCSATRRPFPGEEGHSFVSSPTVACAPPNTEQHKENRLPTRLAEPSRLLGERGRRDHGAVHEQRTLIRCFPRVRARSVTRDTRPSRAKPPLRQTRSLTQFPYRRGERKVHWRQSRVARRRGLARASCGGGCGASTQGSLPRQPLLRLGRRSWHGRVFRRERGLEARLGTRALEPHTRRAVAASRASGALRARTPRNEAVPGNTDHTTLQPGHCPPWWPDARRRKGCRRCA